MIGGFTLGPFSFSGGLLTTFAAIIALAFVGNRLGKARGLDVERKLWIVVGVALLFARAAYVYRFSSYYTAAPLTIIDIRDGGFYLSVGLCAGAATAALLAWRHRSQRIPVLAGAAAGAGVFALSYLAALFMPAPDVGLPEMNLARLDGGTLALPSLAHKPVVLNFWASWCGPCRREMPVLMQAQKDHPEIIFVFVNQEETPEVIRKYLAKEKISLENVVLDDRTRLAKSFKSKALPTTVFFDRRGVQSGRRTGELSAATLAEKLTPLHTPHPATAP